MQTNFNKKYYVALSMLSGFCKSSIETYKGQALDIDEHEYYRLSIYAYSITRDLISKSRLTKKQLLKVSEYIINNVESKLQEVENLHDGKTSPQILMVLCLDYVLNISNNKKLKSLFVGFDLGKLIDGIFMHDKYKEYVKSHSDFIENVF